MRSFEVPSSWGGRLDVVFELVTLGPGGRERVAEEITTASFRLHGADDGCEELRASGTLVG